MHIQVLPVVSDHWVYCRSVERSHQRAHGGAAISVQVGQARERASDTWDRLEKVFEERVHRALRRLEVPSREDLSALIDRVDALNAELRKLGGVPAAKPARARKTAAKKPAPAAKKTPAKRASRKKAAP